MDGIFSVGNISNFCFGNCPVSEKKKFDEEKAINFEISQACEISTHYSVETENVSDISVRIAC